MAVGQMTEVVVFLANTPTAKGAGYVDQYGTLLTTRGRLVANSGSRNLAFGSIADNQSFTLTCRFQTALAAGLRSDTKIVISGVTYTFSSYKLIDQKKHLYEFQIQCQLS